MKVVIGWLLALFLFGWLMVEAGEYDMDRCLNKVSKELGVKTVYRHSRCYAEGFGEIK